MEVEEEGGEEAGREADGTGGGDGDIGARGSAVDINSVFEGLAITGLMMLAL